MEVKFDTDTIRLITMFENLTNALVKDCLVDDLTKTIYFIVDEGMVGIAVGKNGSRVKHVENLFKKHIKIFEFSNDLATFIKNVLPQVTSVKVRNEDERIILEISVEKKDRAMIIGRDGKNLKIYKEILQRSHSVNDLVVK